MEKAELMRFGRRKSLAEDLAEAAGSAVERGLGGREANASVGPEETLAALEEEHRLLSERRRRLHETIDLLQSTERLRPDAAARLEKYKWAEAGVSFERSVLYRRIQALRQADRSHEQTR